MRKIILVVHTSIDGYVAGENGGFDNFDQSPENLDFVCSLTEGADAAMAGKNSYQMLNAYWPTAANNPNASQSEIKYSNWYNAAEKIVLSKSLSGTQADKTTVISDNIPERVREIKEQAGKNIILFGSPTAFETLFNNKLIDEVWIIQYPAIFGAGISFFTRIKNLNRFELLETRQLSKGEIALHYRINL